MRRSEGIEVDGSDILKELSLVKDADDIAAHEAAEAVSRNREFRNLLPVLFEFLNLVQYLVRRIVRYRTGSGTQVNEDNTS